MWQTLKKDFRQLLSWPSKSWHIQLPSENIKENQPYSCQGSQSWPCMKASLQVIPCRECGLWWEKTVTYFFFLLFMRQYDNIALWFIRGHYSLLFNALQKELAIAIRNHQPIYCGKAALFWQDYEIWDVMDCGGRIKWNSQGENTGGSEEQAMEMLEQWKRSRRLMRRHGSSHHHRHAPNAEIYPKGGQQQNATF